MRRANCERNCSVNVCFIEDTGMWLTLRTEQDFSREEDADDDVPSQTSAPFKPPTAAQLDTLRQVILAGFGDRVAR